MPTQKEFATGEVKQIMNPVLTTFADFCEAHFNALEVADKRGITESPNRAQRLRRFYKYAGFQNPKSNSDRFIFTGSCMAVLPPHPRTDERNLVGRLLNIQDNTIQNYRRKYRLKQIPDMPVTTICFRKHKVVDEMFELGKFGVSPWAGAISLNSALLWDTFNLQAARWVIATYGDEVGLKAVTFSLLHESGHQVMEQHRQALCREKDIPDWQFAGSFRRPYRNARTAWELAANELAFLGFEHIRVDSKLVYPDYFADFADPSKEVDSYSHGPDTVRSLTYPNSKYNQPYVVDPQAAKNDLDLSKSPIDDGKSSWTEWMKDYIESNPLIE